MQAKDVSSRRTSRPENRHKSEGETTRSQVGPNVRAFDVLRRVNHEWLEQHLFPKPVKLADGELDWGGFPVALLLYLSAGPLLDLLRDGSRTYDDAVATLQRQMRAKVKKFAELTGGPENTQEVARLSTVLKALEG